MIDRIYSGCCNAVVKHSSLRKVQDFDSLLEENNPMQCARTLVTIVRYVRGAVEHNLDEGLLRMFIHVVSEARDSS